VEFKSYSVKGDAIPKAKISSGVLDISKGLNRQFNPFFNVKFYTKKIYLKKIKKLKNYFKNKK